MSLYFNAVEQPLCPIASRETHPKFTCRQHNLPKIDQMSCTDFPGSCVDDVRDEGLFWRQPVSKIE